MVLQGMRTLHTTKCRGMQAQAVSPRISSLRAPRSVLARSSPDSNEPTTSGSSTSTSSEEKKDTTKATLSSLDSLLGTEQLQKEAEAKAKATPPPPPPQQGNFSAWPTVPKPQAAERKEPPKKGSFTFNQVMSFEGFAPEVINGRAAMLGFFFAISAETKTGESVFAQLLTGGVPHAAAVILAVALASFAPAVIRQVPMDECFNKDPKKEKSVGPFNANAEIRNGRAAMIGIALILLLEGGSGTAFFI